MRDEDTLKLSEEDFDAHWDTKFDAIARVYALRPGAVLTQEDFDAIQRFIADCDENEETALHAFGLGYKRGLEQGGSADIAEMSARLDEKTRRLGLEKALGHYRYEWGFRSGAQAFREMIARFVEQAGDATTAGSIRANWNPGWGEDPGAPESIPETAQLDDPGTEREQSNDPR